MWPSRVLIKTWMWFDLLNRPSWISSTQSTISLSGFNKDSTGADVQSKPSWMAISQSSNNLSGFNIDLTWSQVLSKPTWSQFFPDMIPLSEFYNDLLGLLWDDIRNRPLWTNHFGFSQGLLFNGTYLLQQIVTEKDFVPDTNGIRYLGYIEICRCLLRCFPRSRRRSIQCLAEKRHSPGCHARPC